MADVAAEKVIVGDMGGNQCRFGVATANELFGYQAVDTPPDPEQFLQAIADAVAELHEQEGVETVALGFPGPIEDRGDQTFIGPMPNVSGFTEAVDMRQKLIEANPRLRDLGILILNDTEASVHYLPTLLDQPENRDMLFYVTHSTGVGGDGICGGRTLRESGVRCEVGHMPFYTVFRNPRGGVEYDYNTLETRISGKAIPQIYRSGIRGNDIDEIMADRRAKPIWRQIGREFGRGLSGLVPMLGMSHIVIGGHVSRASDRYEDALRDELSRALSKMPEHIAEPPEVSFLPKELIDTISLRGGYYAAKRRGLLA